MTSVGRSGQCGAHPMPMMIEPTARRILFAFLRGGGRLTSEPEYTDEAALQRALDLLANALSVESIAAGTLPSQLGTIPDYYVATEPQYTALHSEEGALHFGISPDGRFSRSHFAAQPRLLAAQVAETSARAVLELGSGRGFNCLWLAQRCAAANFHGVDLTPENVEIASQRAARYTNATFTVDDFHALHTVDSSSIDLAYDVEAGCYADSRAKLDAMFGAVARVLRPGGRLAVWGYYLPNDFADRSELQQRTVALIAMSWRVHQFPELAIWDELAGAHGFRFVSASDRGVSIMPSVRRLYRQARLYYRVRPAIARLLGRPTHNSVSALLLPFAFALGALVYRQAILVRA